MDKGKTTAVILYGAAVLWGILVAAFVLYLFFPYQRALGIAFQNVLGGNGIVFSAEGLKVRTLGVDASKIVIGHKAIEGKPLFELSKVHVTWNPFAMLKGTLSINSQASAYGGSLQCTIRGIPIFGTERPSMLLTFNDINLERYPEGNIPWFKGLKGTAKGWLKKDVPFAQPDNQKGSFAITASQGEIRELKVSAFPRLILPFKEIVAEGTVRGPTIDITRLSVNSSGLTMKGSGTIESTDQEHRLAIQLTYEALSQQAPLPGRGTITISGSQWSPQITIVKETAELTPSPPTSGEKGVFKGRPAKVNQP